MEKKQLFPKEWDTLEKYMESHPLSIKIPTEHFSDFVRAGIALGESVAEKALHHFVGMAAEEILAKEGIKIEIVHEKKPGEVKILAEYSEKPPTILIYPKRLEAILTLLPLEYREYFADHMMDIATAHELYHYLWGEHYNTNNRTALIGFLDLHPSLFLNQTPENLLSSPVTQEIAALHFSKIFLSLSHSPVLLCLSEHEKLEIEES